jgi:[ribosomal protein S18]-alanine N-acetyltransferase
MSAVLSEQLRCVPMTEDDLDAVAAMESMLYEFPWSRGNFNDSLVAGYSTWTFRLGGALLGYAVMMLVLDEAHLLNISVHSAWQRRGYGRLLLGHLEAVARRSGAHCVFLEVRPSNVSGRGLYAGSGYRQIGVRRGYYPSAWGREDALVLRKDL